MSEKVIIKACNGATLYRNTVATIVRMAFDYADATLCEKPGFYGSHIHELKIDGERHQLAIYCTKKKTIVCRLDRLEGGRDESVSGV